MMLLSVLGAVVIVSLSAQTASADEAPSGPKGVRVSRAMTRAALPQQQALGPPEDVWRRPHPATVPDSMAEREFRSFMERVGEVRSDIGKGCQGRTPDVCAMLVRARCRSDAFYCTDAAFDALYLEVLRLYTRRMPHVRWATAAGYWGFLLHGRPDLARDLGDRCEVSVGWCAMLDGVSLFEDRRWDDADSAYRVALSDLPTEDVCTFTDLSWVLPRHSRYGAIPCSERGEINDTIWWLADPLWSVRGNSRRLEHRHRIATTILHDVHLTLESHPGSVVDWEGHPRSHHPATVTEAWYREGLDRAHFHVVGSGFETARSSTPEGAMEYAFIPSVEAIDRPYGARPDHWDLESVPPVEVASDPDWYYFNPMTQVVAVFERGERKLVAVSAELPEGSAVGGVQDRRAASIVSPAPEEFSIEWDLEPRQRYLFMDTVDVDRFMVGVEVLAPQIRTAARVREGVDRSGRGIGRVRLSDLLLYRTDHVERDPREVREAWVAMLGREWVSPNEEIGVFWEVYGLEEDEPHEVSVRLVPEQGFFGRLAQAIGLGNEDPAGLEWQEGAGAEEGVRPRALDLGLADLDPGRYTLEVTVTVDGQEPVMAQREFEMRAAGG